MQRNPILVVALVLLVVAAGVGGWLAYDNLREMKAEIGQLRGNVAGLQGDLAEAEERTIAERERAEEAEDRAAEAKDLALRLGEHAEVAQGEADSARETAAQEVAARMDAELRRKEAEQERQQAARERAQAEMDAVEARRRLAGVERQRKRDLDRLERSLGKIAETRRTAMGMVMNLGNAIEFDFNRAELRPENREVLSRIAGVLMTAEDFGIEVYGHTDDVGNVAYNQQLSERRAQAVREYLVKAGVDPKVIRSKGFGKGAPLVQGTGDAARQRNRRVEIAVIQLTGELPDDFLVDPPAAGADR